MKPFQIKGISGVSDVFFGDGFSKIEKLCINSTKVVLITDENVERIYKTSFPPQFKVIVIKAGEKSKSLECAEKIYEKLVKLQIDRFSTIIGIGGGVVTDLTGFVASTFLRGIDFGFISTTVLGQVDAAIGGKNGVNFKGYKNLIGLINQPRFVILDVSMLKTLPQKQIVNGMAEVIKSAAILDESLFEIIEKNSNNIFKLKFEILSKIITSAAKIKIKIVNTDEFENSVRLKLNFGHTFGHAIEKISRLSHGEAVAIGMVIAAKISLSRNMITKKEFNRLVMLIEQFKLPTRISIEKAKIINAIYKDKKREGDKINFVLLNKIGRAEIKPVSFAELEKIINDLC